MNTIKKIITGCLLAVITAGIAPLGAVHTRTRDYNPRVTAPAIVGRGNPKPHVVSRLGRFLAKRTRPARDVGAAVDASAAQTTIAARMALLIAWRAGGAVSLAEVANCFYRDDAGNWYYANTHGRVYHAGYLKMLRSIVEHATAVAAGATAGNVIAGNPEQAEAAVAAGEKTREELQEELKVALAQAARFARSSKYLKIAAYSSIAVAIIGAALVWYYWPAVKTALAASSFVRDTFVNSAVEGAVGEAKKECAAAAALAVVEVTKECKSAAALAVAEAKRECQAVVATVAKQAAGGVAMTRKAAVEALRQRGIASRLWDGISVFPFNPLGAMGAVAATITNVIADTTCDHTGLLCRY